MPGTAKEWGLKDRTNIPDSLDAQARYMAYMIKKFNGDYVKALAGYN
ncbi:MAG: lytic transglycosylase domain-containing protein [Snodgrassella sp.]|nr:lytic transglycosylase domain-containing protein [Snodgrassella sp.]